MRSKGNKSRRQLANTHKDNMTPTVPSTETAVTPVKKKIARSLFNLDTFERKSVEKEIEIKEVKSLPEALEVAGNDESQLVKLINIGYRRSQINEAKRSLGGDNMVSPKVVSGFMLQFRALHPLDPKKVDEKGDPTPEARKEQFSKIGAFIRSNPALVELVKQIAAATAAQQAAMDEDEEENEE